MKKLLALILALCMCTMSLPVWAETDADVSDHTEVAAELPEGLNASSVVMMLINGNQ